MKPIKISFDPKDELLLIESEDMGFAKNPLFSGLLRQLKGRSESATSISVPTSATELPSRYQAFAKLLNKLGITPKVDATASAVLQNIELEENRFIEFSNLAYEIWNSQIDTDDFREFVKVISEKCGMRTFYRKQLFSAFHLAFSQNACNFSVPGAGKTSVVYAAYSYLKSLPQENRKSVDRLLIVGPLSSFKAWEDEYHAIFGVRASSKRLSGSLTPNERKDYLRGISLESQNTEITLTSFQALANSEEDFSSFLSQPNRRTMMIIDEAHNIKGNDGLFAAAALRLAPLSHSRVVLTGTPAPNGYEDLFNLFKFIYPTKHIIGFPAPSLRAMTDGTMARAIPELKENIKPFFTRIKKADLGLPEAREHRVAIQMGANQERIYRALERRVVPQLRYHDENSELGLRVRARLIRLRQASVNPELLLRPLEEEGIFDTSDTGDFSIGELEVSELIRGFVADTDLSRLSTCTDLAERIIAEEGKVLIWSYFLGNLDKLKLALGKKASFVEVLTGGTPVSNIEMNESPEQGTREDIIERFHKKGESAILIANPQAVGESISLHKACKSAIYFDRDFNAGRFIQSKDRIHRYSPQPGGQVNYYYLIAPGTVDESIDSRLITKERRLADLVDNEDIPLLTADSDTDNSDDIRAILETYENRVRT